MHHWMENVRGAKVTRAPLGVGAVLRRHGDMARDKGLGRGFVPSRLVMVI
jgi:hypothetical protein